MPPSSASATPAGSDIKAHLGVLAAMAAWGTLVPTAHEVLKVMDGWTLSCIRLVIGAPLLLGLVVLRTGTGWLAGLRWWRILRLGAAVAAFAVLYTMGIALSNPVAAIVIGATNPVISALFATIVLGASVPRGAWTAFALASIGAAIASVDGWSLRPPGGGTRGGELLLILGSLSWTWYSVRAQSWLGGLGQERATALAYLGAASFLAPFYALLVASGFAHWSPAALVWSDWLLLLWIIGVVTLLSGILWNFGVSRIGIVRSSLYQNLSPLFGITVTALLGTYPSVQQLAGCTLVVLAVGSLSLARRGARPAGGADSA